ncbi:hypothetical protein MuYL_4775 [Mucilaginibacter xinganensis]|uniref:Uncharacterized protein n=1 Tax=Mucilaginibacter xinganensis TaxID=1234841 RepID=A0A223P487_9SPHI|nr:hypothetical protein MuYL_4775 [Mucilaginibacter xinganensis]
MERCETCSLSDVSILEKLQVTDNQLFYNLYFLSFFAYFTYNQRVSFF